MAESHVRSIFKAVSWRICGTLSTVLISYLITKQIDLALEIGLIEFVGKIGIFYFHERLWGIIPFGIRKKNEIINVKPRESSNAV